MPKAVYVPPNIERGDIIGSTMERSEAEAEGLMRNAIARETGERPNGATQPNVTGPVPGVIAHAPVNDGMVQQILQAGGVRCASCNGAHFVSAEDVERLVMASVRQDPDFAARIGNLIGMRKERATAIREQVDEVLADAEPFTRDPDDFSAREKLDVLERWDASPDPLDRTALAAEEGVSKAQIAAWKRKKAVFVQEADYEAEADLNDENIEV